MLILVRYAVYSAGRVTGQYSHLGCWLAVEMVIDGRLETNGISPIAATPLAQTTQTVAPNLNAAPAAKCDNALVHGAAIDCPVTPPKTDPQIGAAADANWNVQNGCANYDDIETPSETPPPPPAPTRTNSTPNGPADWPPPCDDCDSPADDGKCSTIALDDNDGANDDRMRAQTRNSPKPAPTSIDGHTQTDQQRRQQRDSLGQLSQLSTDKRHKRSHGAASLIVRRFQKFDATALSSAPSPDVKIGQRVAYKEYYGNEFGTIRWIGECGGGRERLAEKDSPRKPSEVASPSCKN